jgi:hypothetical protein
MYALANTTVSIMRGTQTESFGDIIDKTVPVYQHIIAFISYPTMSPLRPVVLGSQVTEPAGRSPGQARLAACNLPWGTDVRGDDQIYDEFNSVLYQIYEVTELGWTGASPDLILTLKRITNTEQV